MDSFALKPRDEQRTIITEAASRREVTPIIIEKDYWVCWTLRRLAEHPDLSPWLTFKGGTSLSKCHGLMARFSEDIDLTVGRYCRLHGWRLA
jgi:predicted nucleotidyltransferase component of viral defense system